MSTTLSLFQAEWPAVLPSNVSDPKKKFKKIMFYLAACLIFPLGAFLLLSFLSRILATYILFPSLIRRVKKNKEDLLDPDIEKCSFKTPDKRCLEGFYYEGENPDYVILYKGGQNSLAQDFISKETFNQSLSNISNLGKCSVFTYNTRGVGNSEGFPEKSVIGLDSYSAFEYLVKIKNISPENILFMGHSLGSAELVEGAVLAQQKYGISISFVSHCTFGNLNSTFQHLVPPLRFVSKTLLKWVKWYWKPVDAFRKLEGEKCIIHSSYDDILGKSSLYQSLEEEEKTKVTEIILTDLSFDFSTETKRKISLYFHNLNPVFWHSDHKKALETFIKSKVFKFEEKPIEVEILSDEEKLSREIS